MNGPNLSDAVVGRLAAVLARVLETGSSESSVPSEPGGPEMRRLALSGATAVLPAVLALQQLQERVRAHGGADSWNGLLHRRCLMILSGSGEAASEAFQNSPGPSLRRIVHAEWELVRAVVEVRVGGRQWRVVHELARRTPVDRPATAVRGKLTELGAGFDPPDDGAFYRLGSDDIAAWAEATGDRNAIHLLPGRAARAGLQVGPDDVVAHGLLVGALSLAVCAPSTRHQTSLRFTGPVEVPIPRQDGRGQWASLAVSPGAGDVVQGGRPVLRRR